MENRDQAPPQPGWGDDGIYRVTKTQLRDPAWCFSPQWKELQKSGAYEILADQPYGDDWARSRREMGIGDPTA